MRALEIAVLIAGALDPKSSDLTAGQLKNTAARLTARMPTVLATYHRLRQGLEPVAPRDDLGHSANFLWMLTGEEPDELAARVFDVAMILHAEHEMNASTFSALVTASTLSDMYSAIASAIGTLKGPLHGGANEAVYKTVEAIGRPNRTSPRTSRPCSAAASASWASATASTRRPTRAPSSSRSSATNSPIGHPDRKYFDLSLKLRDYLAGSLEGKPLYPNVDFFSASVYKMLGIPSDLYTPIFAMSRIAGWTAHLLEQYADNRLVRPNALYEGATNRDYVPVGQR